jgi:hypothetical protein
MCSGVLHKNLGMTPKIYAFSGQTPMTYDLSERYDLCSWFLRPPCWWNPKAMTYKKVCHFGAMTYKRFDCIVVLASRLAVLCANKNAIVRAAVIIYVS